jgi:RimJ/RimL family protein N-acetyltransferase
VKSHSVTVELRATIPDQARTWRNELGVRRWALNGDLISDREHDAWCARVQTDPTVRIFGIWVRDENSETRAGFVGVCSFSEIDFRNQRARFSIYIAADYQKRGYGAYALSSLLDYGFNELNLNCAYGESIEGNPANRLFAKLGARQQGVLFDAVYRRGKFQDLFLWAFLRKDLYRERHLDRPGDGDERIGSDLKPYFSSRERADAKPNPLDKMVDAAVAERLNLEDGVRLHEEIEERRRRERGPVTDPLRFGSEDSRAGPDEKRS